MKGTQRKQTDKRIDFAKREKRKRACFVSSPWQESDVLLCSRLVKHDSLFSSDTKPIIWTFVDRWEKSSFTNDRNRHFEGCGKKRACGGSMKSIHQGSTSSPVLNTVYKECVIIVRRKSKTKTNKNSCLDGGLQFILGVLMQWCTGWRPKKPRMSWRREDSVLPLAACVRGVWRAGRWQRYGAHSNWICQNSAAVNVVPLLSKAAAHWPAALHVWSMAPFVVFLLLPLFFVLVVPFMAMMALMMLTMAIVVSFHNYRRMLWSWNHTLCSAVTCGLMLSADLHCLLSPQLLLLHVSSFLFLHGRGQLTTRMAQKSFAQKSFVVMVEI